MLAYRSAGCVSAGRYDRGMSDTQQSEEVAEREARREVLADAIADLPNSDDPSAAAKDILRALDGYIESERVRHPAQREAPVADFSGKSAPPSGETKWALWAVLGVGVLTTILVVSVLSGGWPAALAVAAIWVAALVALSLTG